MSKSKNKPTMTEVIKAAIENCGVSRYRIAQATGILEPSLSRFMRGETTILLNKADVLAEYLGYRLVIDPEAKPPEPTPEKLARPMLAKRTKKRKAK